MFVVKAQNKWKNYDDEVIKPFLIYDWPNVKIAHREIARKIQGIHTKISKITREFLLNKDKN